MGAKRLKSLVLYICTYCTYSGLIVYCCLGTIMREDLYIADVSCMVARTTIYRIMQRRKRNYLPLHIPHQIPPTPGPPNDLRHLRMIIVGVLLQCINLVFVLISQQSTRELRRRLLRYTFFVDFRNSHRRIFLNFTLK